MSLGVSALAAAPPDVLPPGPLLNRAPDFAAWTLLARIAGGQPAATGSSAPETAKDGVKKGAGTREVLVIKTGKIVYERLVDRSGRRSEIWHDNGVQLLIPSSGAAPLIFPDYGGGDIYTPNYSVSDFAGLDWISPDTFTGIQKVMGRDCMVFRGQVNALPGDERREMDLQASRERLRNEFAARSKGATQPSPDTASSGPKASGMVAAVACIDLDARLPVAVTFGTETVLYQFGTPPTAMLSLPPALAAAASGFQAKIQRLSKLPAAP
jgi:hypothetical protein